jgi:hypothetical protein
VDVSKGEKGFNGPDNHGDGGEMFILGRTIAEGINASIF